MMWNGKQLSVVLPIVAALGLYGCDSGDNTADTAEAEATKPTAEHAETMAEQAGDAMSGAADQAGEAVASAAEQAPSMIEAAKDQVAAAAASLPTIDAGSLDSFKSSLNAMKGSLDMDGQAQLSSALAGMASNAMPTDAGGLLGAAKGAASGGSAEDSIYSAFGSKLNGLNFEQLLAFAKNLG